MDLSGASTVPASERLIVFTRYPLPGKAKTRLIPALGAEGAAALQRQMTEYTMQQARQLLDLQPLAVEVWFTESLSPGVDCQLMEGWLGSTWSYQPQVTGDLGTRMAHAICAAFQGGGQRIVTIGSDCPGLDTDTLRQAFQALQTHDLVLGPATDGGYYLIGLRQFVPELFAGIAWSTAQVLSQTVEIAERLGLSIAYLDPLTDIDRPEDLSRWQPTATIPSPEISIIIPVLNEANTIEAVLQTIQSSRQTDRPIEIIVVDGGSHDNTVALAKQTGATVITTQAGRAYQMNVGARAALGKVLLFLHADTRLPHGFDAHIQQTLDNPGTIAGAFQLRIDGQERALRWVEWGVLWRSRFLQLPYGDQALFLRAQTFRQAQGFPELPIMEDFVFVRRLQALGKIAIAPAAVTTSARRWQKLGVFKTTLINQLIITGYFLGVSPERMSRWYRSAEGRTKGDR